MKVVCEPDRLRFIDESAPGNDSWVHSVEVSDERCSRQFVTLFTKDRREAVAKRYPVHERETLHGGEVPQIWVADCWGERRWASHFHILLEHPPTWQDLSEFKVEMSNQLQDELRTNL